MKAVLSHLILVTKRFTPVFSVPIKGSSVQYHRFNIIGSISSVQYSGNEVGKFLSHPMMCSSSSMSSPSPWFSFSSSVIRPFIPGTPLLRAYNGWITIRDRNTSKLGERC